jgi:hypothetical protein
VVAGRPSPRSTAARPWPSRSSRRSSRRRPRAPRTRRSRDPDCRCRSRARPPGWRRARGGRTPAERARAGGPRAAGRGSCAAVGPRGRVAASARWVKLVDYGRGPGKRQRAGPSQPLDLEHGAQLRPGATSSYSGLSASGVRERSSSVSSMRTPPADRGAAACAAATDSPAGRITARPSRGAPARWPHRGGGAHTPSVRLPSSTSDRRPSVGHQGAPARLRDLPSAGAALVLPN